MRGYISYFLESAFNSGIKKTGASTYPIKVESIKVSYTPNALTLTEAGTARPYQTVYFDDQHKIEFTAVFRASDFKDLFRTCLIENGSDLIAYGDRLASGLYPVPEDSVSLTVGFESVNKAYKYNGAFVKTLAFNFESKEFVKVTLTVIATSRENASFAIPLIYSNEEPAKYMFIDLEIGQSTSGTLRKMLKVKRLSSTLETGFLERNAWIDTTEISAKDFGGESSLVCTIEAFDTAGAVHGSGKSIVENMEGWIPASRLFNLDAFVKTAKLTMKGKSGNTLAILSMSSAPLTWEYSQDGATFITTLTTGGVYEFKYTEV